MSEVRCWWQEIRLGPSHFWSHTGLGPGPILYLVYINDLPENIRLFADDTAVYLTTEGANDNLTLQNDLDRLGHRNQPLQVCGGAGDRFQKAHCI